MSPGLTTLGPGGMFFYKTIKVHKARLPGKKPDGMFQQKLREIICYSSQDQ